MDEERGKAEKRGATESSKATKVTKHKAVKATKPAGDKAPKPTATQPPKPKPAPTQPSKAVLEKKRKLVIEILWNLHQQRDLGYFIFQRRPPMPTESSAHVESPSMDAELNLTDSKT
ncbi:hypothetical protein Tco_0065106 [Tanacetum coccineum]